MSYNELVRRIYDINEKDFEGVAMEVWKYQYSLNPIYQAYCHLLEKDERTVHEIRDIPFLPIQVFKSNVVKADVWSHEEIFTSSGTTGMERSKHYVRHLDWYHKVSEKCFSHHFKAPHQFVWLGLLPSYLERSDSSLVAMVHQFMKAGAHEESGFFPEINEELIGKLELLKQMDKKVILIGVSFALLDLFERFNVPVWSNLLVMETGGMKGRGQELTRNELYERLRSRHEDLRISSEYGMTELLSQAYSDGTYFNPGPTMRVLIRDISDPLSLLEAGQRGVINVVDLANIDTCSFIATDDIGISYANGHFDVLGRLDNSDLRGCNLMYV